MARVTVYGADWCEDTGRTRRFLDELGIRYDYVNIEHKQSAMDWVTRHNNGKAKTPTLDVAGAVVSVPDDKQLDRVLHEKGLLK